MNTVSFLSAASAFILIPFGITAGEEKILMKFRAYDKIEQYIGRKKDELKKVTAQEHGDPVKFKTYEVSFYDGFFDISDGETDIKVCKNLHETFIKPVQPRFGINKFKVMSPRSQKLYLEKGTTPIIKRVNNRALVQYHTSTSLLDTLEKIERYTQKHKQIYRQKLFSSFTPTDITFYAHQVDEKIKHVLPQITYDQCKKNKCNVSLQYRIAQLNEIKNKITHHAPLTQEVIDVMSDLEMDEVNYIVELGQLTNKNIHFVFVEDMLRQLENGTFLHTQYDASENNNKVIMAINKKLQDAYHTQQQNGLHPVAILTDSLRDLKELFSLESYPSIEQA